MRKFIVLAFLILSVGFVSACSGDDYVFKEKISETKYYPRYDKAVTTTTYIDYENEDRYPTYDYRHGYTYRSTREYRDSYKVKRTYSESYTYSGNYRRDFGWDPWRDEGRVYYEYVPHIKEWKKGVCYTSAPSDKLFYIKC